MGLRKGDLLLYLDIGLVGTFVEFIEEGMEEGYVKIKYVPLDSFWGKKYIHEKPIKRDYIKYLMPDKTYPGVEKRIVLVFTAEEGSIIQNVVDSEHIKLINKLQEQIRGLRKQIASSRQEASDAQSGVNKSIEKMRSLNRSTRPTFGELGGGTIPSPFGVSERYSPSDLEDEGGNY